MGHLERIREVEWKIVRPVLPPRSRVLEIGGGGGFQARLMARDGFNVVSVDIQTNSEVAPYFRVLFYDGTHLAYETGTFDIVYSSNALEHVRDLEGLLQEMNRVLMREGMMIHLVPSGSWRFWTTLTHYLFLVKYAVSLGKGARVGGTRTTISGTVKAKG